MTAIATIKFTQGPNTAPAEVAVKGTLASVDGPVVVTNGDNTDVQSWQIVLLDAPPWSMAYPPSANPQVLAAAVSNTPTANFSPDARGGEYRVMLDVVDNFGNRNRDIRCFGVPDERGVIVPAYQKNPDPLPIALPAIITPINDPQIKLPEQNYSNQTRGWAGEDGHGLSAFFQNYEDGRVASMTTTPYAPAVRDPNTILVSSTTIGSASVVNLPSATRVGQHWAVQDVQDAFTYPITVNLPGGSTFPDGTTSRVIFASGGLLVVRRVSASGWVICVSTSREEFIDLFASQSSTSATAGFVRVSSRPLDPSRFPLNTRYTFEAVMETTNASNAHEVRLFNVTLSTAASDVLSSTSLTPEAQSDVLLSPADLAAGMNLYEVQHRMAAGISPDEVTISGAHLRVVFATTG